MPVVSATTSCLPPDKQWNRPDKELPHLSYIQTLLHMELGIYGPPGSFGHNSTLFSAMGVGIGMDALDHVLCQIIGKVYYLVNRTSFRLDLLANLS